MSQDHQAGINREYLLALEEFHKIRDQETRISTSGQTFVLVNNVTQRLIGPSLKCPPEYHDSLDWLGQTAYLRHRPEPPKMRREHYRNYEAVFYTLLDIGAPELIHEFKNHELDSHRLPIDLETLKSRIEQPPNNVHFHIEFHQRQFSWCPTIQLDLDMSKADPECVIPFSRKRNITTSRDSRSLAENTATLYEIDVLEELVGERLQSCMSSARIDRKERKETEKVPLDSLSKGHVSILFTFPSPFNWPFPH